MLGILVLDTSPPNACRFATAVSALVAKGLGSDAGVASYEETEKAMRSMKTLD